MFAPFHAKLLEVAGPVDTSVVSAAYAVVPLGADSEDDFETRHFGAWMDAVPSDPGMVRVFVETSPDGVHWGTLGRSEEHNDNASTWPPPPGGGGEGEPDPQQPPDPEIHQGIYIPALSRFVRGRVVRAAGTITDMSIVLISNKPFRLDPVPPPPPPPGPQ